MKKSTKLRVKGMLKKAASAAPTVLSIFLLSAGLATGIAGGIFQMSNDANLNQYTQSTEFQEAKEEKLEEIKSQLENHEIQPEEYATSYQYYNSVDFAEEALKANENLGAGYIKNQNLCNDLSIAAVALIPASAVGFLGATFLHAYKPVSECGEEELAEAYEAELEERQ